MNTIFLKISSQWITLGPHPNKICTNGRMDRQTDSNRRTQSEKERVRVRVFFTFYGLLEAPLRVFNRNNFIYSSLLPLLLLPSPYQTPKPQCGVFKYFAYAYFFMIFFLPLCCSSSSSPHQTYFSAPFALLFFPTHLWLVCLNIFKTTERDNCSGSRTTPPRYLPSLLRWSCLICCPLCNRAPHPTFWMSFSSDLSISPLPQRTTTV